MTKIENAQFFKHINGEMRYAKYLTLVCAMLEEKNDDQLEAKLEKADKVIDTMTKLVHGYKALPTVNGDITQKWFEVLITAAYLYGMLYDHEEKYLSLMAARQYTKPIADAVGIPVHEQEYIFEGYESVAGALGPQKLKTQHDTPGEMLALAVFIVENL